MGQQSSAEIQTPLYGLVQPVLQVLRDDFAEHYLLGKILRAYANRVAAIRRGAAAKPGQQAYDAENLRSTHPSPPSPTKAISAAGIAPARI